MREIKTHQVNECNSAITIRAENTPGPGGAPSRYFLSWPLKDAVPDPESAQPATKEILIDFQNGPIKEVGTNGLTHEVLLAVLIDRLDHFQRGPYACEENRLALLHLETAQAMLHARTKTRLARGVEGTLTV